MCQCKNYHIERSCCYTMYIFVKWELRRRLRGVSSTTVSPVRFGILITSHDTMEKTRNRFLKSSLTESDVD